jgi:hypothetical protein
MSGLLSSACIAVKSMIITIAGVVLSAVKLIEKGYSMRPTVERELIQVRQQTKKDKQDLAYIKYITTLEESRHASRPMEVNRR